MEVFNMITCPKIVNKWQREILDRVGHTFERVAWTMDE
jgi:hypothetical protein